MHQLILMRHAKAVPPAEPGPDHERALTPAGQAAAAAMGGAMRKAGLAPEVVLVSSARRTLQTLDALESAQVWDEWPNIDTLPNLYMAGHAQILSLLREQAETVRSLLVIGHNPGLHELALLLAGPTQAKPALARLVAGFPTSSVAVFSITTPWLRLAPGAAIFEQFLLSSDLL